MFDVIYDGKLDEQAGKEVFSKAISDLAHADKEVIYLDADLMNSSGTYALWSDIPEQVIESGIQESNMIGVAAGLSVVGRKPYCHSFAPFVSRRSYDQIFISVAYAGNSVRIYGSDPGVTAAFNGGTHMPFEDLSLYRAIPEATIFDIADAAQFDWVIREVKDRPGLSYFRYTRKSYSRIYSKDSTFEIGKGNLIRDGKDLTIFATGLMLGEAMQAAEALESEGISIRVVDMFTVKPLDEEMVIRCAKETGAILTTENHNIIGGLGDAVGSCLAQNNICVPFRKHGVMDQFGQVGDQAYLQEVFGLTAENLIGEAKKVISQK